MGLIDKYPYTNYAGINLDYYIKQVNDIQAELPAYIKDVSISGNTIIFTKGNDNTISITIPTGSAVNVTCTRTFEDTWLFSDDLSVGDEVEYTTDITSAEFNALKDNIKLGNPTFIHVIGTTAANFYTFLPYLFNTSVIVDITGRGDDNEYINRSFVVSHHYNAHTGNHIVFTRVI